MLFLEAQAMLLRKLMLLQGSCRKWLACWRWGSALRFLIIAWHLLKAPCSAFSAQRWRTCLQWDSSAQRRRTCWQWRRKSKTPMNVPICILTSSAGCHMQGSKPRWHSDICGCGDTFTTTLQGATQHCA